MHAHKPNNKYHPNPHPHNKSHNQTPIKAQKNTNVITK